MAHCADYISLAGIPIGLVQDVASLMASLLQKLTGKPTDVQVIVEALREGLERFATVGDRYADAALVRANAELVRAHAELVSAKARLLEAEANIIKSQRGTHAGSGTDERESGGVTIQTIVENLRTLAIYIANYEMLIEQPLLRLRDSHKD